MKKKYTVIGLALIMTAFLLLVPSATAKKPLKCEQVFEFDWDLYQWIGTLSGDITGEIVITPSAATFPGRTEHFIETFEITTDGGAIIRGYDIGIWNFNTGRFRTNGYVTQVIDDSGELLYLIGYHVHFQGVTTTVLDGITPLTGEGSIRIY